MPSGKNLLAGALTPVLALLLACGGGGGSSHRPAPPKSNIDLAVTDLSISPAAADPEDNITVSFKIQNLGTEAANEMLGDKFRVRLNLSKDGTFELNEQGFLEETVTDLIPAGGETPLLTYTAPYGGGDTLSIYSNFCNSLECVPPETGVIGVKVDATDEINELEEGNNFQFQPIEVVGTRVAATFTGCSFGLAGGSSAPGCNLQVSDSLVTLPSIHYPCSTCGSSTDILFQNELSRFVYATITLKGCTDNNTPSGFCSGSWLISGTTEKPGHDANIVQQQLTCIVYFGQGSDRACQFAVEVRDPNY